MNSLTRISRRKLYHELIVRFQSTAATSSSSDIYIPNRIERGPTDILKALESTISRDYTATHYKFHDDPYLSPMSKMHNRVYALAREAGKKAAIWIRQEHSDLFQHKVADPEIKAFVPPVVYTEESKVTEETLLYEISNANIPDSITVYDFLKGEITVPTKQALLELLCYYNSSEPNNTELLETRWYQHSQKHNKNTWINRPQIDILFQFLKTQESAVAAAAYNTLICGMAKYFNVDKAWNLYKECQENNIPLCIDGYNAIILLVPLLRDGDEKQQTLTMDIFKEMTSSGIIPDIHTFNAAIYVGSNFRSNRTAIDFTRRILADIGKFHLKPCLTTYYYVLRILSKCGDAAYQSFIDIIKILKNQTLIVQNVKDTNFFATAMEMASRQFCDRQAGEMVNDLLLTGENYKFIGDNYRENIYYRGYLELILTTEDFEIFFKLYNKLVPHVTIPEPTVMKAILETLQAYPAQTATQYIPKLWSHIIMFGHLDRQDLVGNLLQLFCVYFKPALDSPLNVEFANIAVTIWDHVQNQRTRKIQNTIMSNIMIGDLIVLLLRGEKFDKAIEVMSLLIQSPHLVIGTITTEYINEIFELCLTQTHVPAILILFEYITSYDMEGLEQMAKTLYKTIPLDSAQKNKLISLVGNDILQLELSNKH